MEKVKFHKWEIFPKKTETERFYNERFKGGESDFCTCLNCRNFKIQKNHLFPLELNLFFNSLGINNKFEDRLAAFPISDSNKIMYNFTYFFIGSLCFELSDLNNEIDLYDPIPLNLILQPENENKSIYSISVTSSLSWVIEELPIPELNYKLSLMENENYILEIRPVQKQTQLKISISPEKKVIFNGIIPSEQNFKLIIAREDMKEKDALIIETNFESKDHQTYYLIIVTVQQINNFH